MREKAHTPHELQILADMRFMRRKEELLRTQVRRHDAAGHGRRFDPSHDIAGTANFPVGAELDVLRRRSLSMQGNNGYASQGTTVLVNGIVGAGIKASVRKNNKALEDRILKEWIDWTEHHQCDHMERKSFAAIQQQVIRTVIDTGEAIVRRRRLKDGRIQLQVHEGDYLDGGMHGLESRGEGFTMHGIEYSVTGKPVAYWLYDTLESDSLTINNFNSRRVPAEEVIHVFYEDRAGQRRGLPWFRKVYISLMDLTKYMDVDLQRAIVAACFSVFVSGSREGMVGFSEVEAEQDDAMLEPGLIKHNQPGETTTPVVPPAHNSFGDYVKAILRQIAAGIGITYEALSGDYSQVNFASAKMAFNEQDRNFAEKRVQVMHYFLNRVWEWHMENMVMRGLLAMPLEQALKIRADWTPARRAMIDVVKETDGLLKQVEAGFISWAEAVRFCGGDPDDVAKEILANFDQFEKAGINLAWMVRNAELHELTRENDARNKTADASKRTADASMKSATAKTKPESPEKASSGLKGKAKEPSTK